MGAKQSKRSVDISGKEAENVGEVAVAGAGGEGRMEPLADADALKPQINGDAHIHEESDKEKQLDSGTPENEKDATTEKEEKNQEDDKEKEAALVANGESGEQKENGESPAPEDGKKPKKEKVKKKWSLRSISFSRKEKPKQEKKQKEEEAKTNGDPEKVPEETAETTPEAPKTETAVESKADTESKDEKTPETPVTEPITNGSSTPESTVETPAEEPARPEPKAEPEPEQLPINGLSLEEPKHISAEAPQSEESKPEEPIAETTESTPAPEIPVIKEVCVEQMPLIESTPPPLPANPPPSSVASFAATTMAPELTDASLANTTESAIISPSFVALETKPIANKLDETPLVTNIETELNPQLPSLKEVDDCKPEDVVNAENKTPTPIVKNIKPEVELAPRLNEGSEGTPPVEEVKTEPAAPLIESSPIITNVEPEIDLPPPLDEASDVKIVEEVKPEPEQQKIVEEVKAEPEQEKIVEEVKAEPEQEKIVEEVKAEPEQQKIADEVKAEPEQQKIVEEVKAEPEQEKLVEEIKAELEQQNNVVEVKVESEKQIYDLVETSKKVQLNDVLTPTSIESTPSEAINIPAPTAEDALAEDISESEPCISPPAEPEIPENPDALDSVDDLPPPPPVDDDFLQTDIVENVEPADKVEVIINHVSEIVSGTNGIDKESINGIDDKQENMKGDHIEETAPPAAAPAQEPLPVSDKIADLIPEVPVVPELKSETDMEVALTN